MGYEYQNKSIKMLFQHWFDFVQQWNLNVTNTAEFSSAKQVSPFSGWSCKEGKINSRNDTFASHLFVYVIAAHSTAALLYLCSWSGCIIIPSLYLFVARQRTQHTDYCPPCTCAPDYSAATRQEHELLHIHETVAFKLLHRSLLYFLLL